VGQEHVITTLRNAIAAGRLVHAYLFAGPRGTGKTTTARLLARAANCLEADLAARPCSRCEPCQAVIQGRFLDLVEIDAASNTSVEDVRDLRDKINFTPNLGLYRVYIIDEVHMLSTAAFNALLKTLEEPPPHAIFILATTEVHKIPATVLSRCQRHEFRRIPLAEILGYLKKIAQEEQIDIDVQALTLIARQSTGAMRDAISLLDQLSSTGEAVSLEMAQAVLGTATSQAVLDLVQALVDQQSAAGLEHIHAALDSGSDPRQFARQVVDYLRDLLLILMKSADQLDATPEIRAQMARHAQAFSIPALLAVIRVFNFAAVEAKSSWQPALPLEMAFIEAQSLMPSANQPPPAEPAKVDRPSAGESARSTKQANRSETQSVSAPPPDVPESTAQPETGELSLSLVEQNWRQVVDLVRKVNPSTQGLLNSCQSMGVKDGILYLGFSTENVRALMEKGDNLTITRKALSETLGREVEVRCIVAGARRNPLPADVDREGMVASALRDLGGEIVDIK
jgi:DNA polymerase-3 subunit gamma/tau